MHTRGAVESKVGRLRRAASSCAVVVALGAIGGLISASPAQAGLLDATCTGTQTATYSPGLLLTPQFVFITASTSYTPCASVSDPAITSAHFGPSTFPTTMSCLDLLSTRSGSTTITWNTGETTTFSYTVTRTNSAGQYVSTYLGTVTAGKFLGDTVSQTFAGVTPNLIGCLAPPGVTSESGAAVLEVTSIP
jgi:hypothetical protein